MAAKSIDLDQIIDVVAEANPGSALDRVSGARAMAARLETLSQHVIAQFVEEARQGGASWTQIGSALGVTRQAAQQRFVSSESPDFASATSRGLPYAARAATSIEAARALASDHGHRSVDDAHVLLGLLENRTGAAISALKLLGVRTADLRKSARASLPGDTKRKTANPALGRSGVKALELAEREALRAGSAVVDTEHVLLGLLGDADSSVAKLFADAGQDYAAVRAAVTAEAAAEKPAKKTAKRAR